MIKILILLAVITGGAIECNFAQSYRSSNIPKAEILHSCRVDVLDERERVIVEDYFGLSGSTRTLEDIGNDFTLTKERVRQIKEKALRKLRNETASLFEYFWK